MRLIIDFERSVQTQSSLPLDLQKSIVKQDEHDDDSSSSSSSDSNEKNDDETVSQACVASVFGQGGKPAIIKALEE